MLGGGRKSNSKSAKNQPFLLIVPAIGPFYAFSLHRGPQPSTPSSTVRSPSSPPQVVIKPPHVMVAPLLSLSSVKIFSATVTPAATTTTEEVATTSPRSYFPSQRQPGSSSLLNHSNYPNRKLPFSFLGLHFFFFFQRRPEPATGLTTLATMCATSQATNSLNDR